MEIAFYTHWLFCRSLSQVWGQGRLLPPSRQLAGSWSVAPQQLLLLLRWDTKQQQQHTQLSQAAHQHQPVICCLLYPEPQQWLNLFWGIFPLVMTSVFPLQTFCLCAACRRLGPMPGTGSLVGAGQPGNVIRSVHFILEIFLLKVTFSFKFMSS